MAKRGKPEGNKLQRERDKQRKRKEKEERKRLRKEGKLDTRSVDEGPDDAGPIDVLDDEIDLDDVPSSNDSPDLVDDDRAD